MRKPQIDVPIELQGPLPRLITGSSRWRCGQGHLFIHFLVAGGATRPRECGLFGCESNDVDALH